MDDDTRRLGALALREHAGAFGGLEACGDAGAREARPVEQGAWRAGTPVGVSRFWAFAGRDIRRPGERSSLRVGAEMAPSCSRCIGECADRACKARYTAMRVGVAAHGARLAPPRAGHPLERPWLARHAYPEDGGFALVWGLG